MEITIFNSWQSDSEFNRKAIADALRLANIEVEKKIDGLRIKIDESNSNVVGSHHIPSSIFLNISNADIFVCDLSMIGQSFSGERKIPNPNVLVELGYAVSVLSWNRIVILLNKSSGDFKDLPFDLEKRSCLGFKVITANDPNGIGALKTLLVDRIAEIVKANPPKPVKDASESNKKKRESDIKTLSSILNLFRIKMMDYFFKEGHLMIADDVMEAYNEFLTLTESKAFILFDEEAKARVMEFKRKLAQLPTLIGTHYNKKRYLGFENKAQKIKDNTGAKKYEPAKEIIRTIDPAFSSLYQYIRQYYHEIDTNTFFKYKDEDEEEDETVL